MPGGFQIAFRKSAAGIGLCCTPKPDIVQRKVDASNILSDRYFSRIPRLPNAAPMRPKNDRPELDRWKRAIEHSVGV
jgi:hypothetical protein